ncbi:transcriptional regulator [Actinomycetes bacterium M1A6_2h]
MTPLLDDTLSTPVRLKICGYLAGCEEADFKVVQEYCGLSQSNLSKQITTLSDRGYLTISKVSASRYTTTRLKVTDAGRTALAGHVAYLQSIVESAAQHSP